MPYVTRLVAGKWETMWNHYGWKEANNAEGIIPVYAWPDGSEIWSTVIHLVDTCSLCHAPSRFSKFASPGPTEVTFDPKAREFVGGSIESLTPLSASSILTFLHECGMDFSGEGLRQQSNMRSLIPRYNTTLKMCIDWTWMAGGQFIGTNKEEVELDVLLGNVPFPLLETRALEERIRETNGWKPRFSLLDNL